MRRQRGTNGRGVGLLAMGVALAAGAALSVLAAGPVRATDKPVRKPGVSFLLSAILPGAGQLYNGDQRGYVYLGVEAATWFARFSYLDAGNRREGEYESYARRHWTFARYRGSDGEPGCNWTSSNDSVLVMFFNRDVQQFYEEIGKYDKYRCGWDDFAESYDPGNDRSLSPHRKTYRGMREQSNDLLNNARLALAASVVNRVVSAVDALRTARGRQRPSAFRLESGFSGGDAPRAELRLVRMLP